MRLGVKLKPMTPETFCDPLYTKALGELVTRIVQAESPVSFDVVSAEMLEMLGITKNSAKLKARCDYLVKYSKVPFTMQNLDGDGEDEGTKILWADQASSYGICPFYRVPVIGGKPRKASDIAVQEAARAAIDIAEEQMGLPRQSLITETAKALGFTRTASTTDCYKLCEKAVDFAFDQDALSIDDNGFITPSNSFV